MKYSHEKNILDHLKANGIDPSQCDGACEVEIGRNIGADLIVTGNILKDSEMYYLRLKLHETKGGTLKQGQYEDFRITGAFASMWIVGFEGHFAFFDPTLTVLAPRLRLGVGFYEASRASPH